MTIIDKLIRGRIDESGLRRITAFVESYASEVREFHSEAIRDGIEQPLVWLVDSDDDFGKQLAKLWFQDDPNLASARDDCRPGVLLRAVSFRKARERFSKSTLMDVAIPEPSHEQIDVLAATQGGIWVVGLPLTPDIRLVPRPGELMAVLDGQLASPKQDILMQAIVEPLQKTQEGVLIKALAIPWFEILREIERDPDFLYRFAQHPRKFEEFIAASYEREGWSQVELTPQRGDRGRDVIATIPGIGSVRFLDQCKALSPGRLVTHDEVRAMLGVLQLNPNASKAIVTTTSDFAPGIRGSGEFDSVMPYRLELRNGEELRKWLREIAAEHST